MGMLSEVGDYVDAAGIATQGTDLFLQTMPEEPDTCATLFQYPGNLPEYVQDVRGPDVEMPQLQVVARAKTSEAAEALAYAIWMLLAQINNQVLGTTYYRSIFPNASPGLMGRDANDRVLVSFNCTVAKEVPVGASS